MLKATQLMLVCTWTLIFAPCQWAQQEEQAAPVQDQTPAAPAEEPAASTTLVPDTRPLSGAEVLRVETPGQARNYVVPSLRISAFGDTNRTILTTGQNGTEMTGSIVAGLDAHRVSRRSDFAMDYKGGGIFYARDTSLNAMMHDLSITERYTGRRWGLTLGDQFAYLPESSFGFGGYGPSVGWGGSTGGWTPSQVPGQSLFSGGGNRLYNAALAQIEYSASARSSFTFGGNYGLIRFLDPGFVDSNSLYANTGYNYKLNRRDTISVNYGFGAMRFIGPDLHLDNHVISISYAKRLTGRLAFSVSGGPQIVLRRTPLFGSIKNTDLFANATFSYSVGRTDLNWSYAHYTSNGSGVFLGARTDLFNGSFQRRLSRNWTWSIGPGYSRNSRLGSGQGTVVGSGFDSIYGQTSFQRNLGRYTDLSMSYNINTQWSSTTVAAGTARSNSYLRHYFGVSVTWHGSRIGLD